MAATKKGSARKKAPAKKVAAKASDLDVAFEIRVPAKHFPPEKRVRGAKAAANAIQSFIEQHHQELMDHVRKAVPDLQSSDFAFRRRSVKCIPGAGKA